LSGEIQQPTAGRDDREVGGDEMFLASVRLCFADIVALSFCRPVMFQKTKKQSQTPQGMGALNR